MITVTLVHMRQALIKYDMSRRMTQLLLLPVHDSIEVTYGAVMRCVACFTAGRERYICIWPLPRPGEIPGHNF